MSTKPIIFIAYSHNDEPDRYLAPSETRWLTYVKSFLEPAEANGLLELWNDRRIDGGGNWRVEIQNALERCAVCVLLVSRFSLSSRFILDIEIKRMLERHYARGAHIYPILITSTDLGVAPWLLELNLKPTNAIALELYDLGPRNKVMSELAAEIRAILERSELSAAGVGTVQPTHPLNLRIAELAREATYALAMVRIPFEAFQFRSDQLEQWELLTLLLQKEREWKIYDADVRRPLEGFRNDDGEFLTYIGQSKRKGQSVRIYQFNERFDAAVDRYLALFFESGIASGLKPRDLSLERKRLLIKAIHDVQVKKYYPAWQKLVNCFGTTAASNGVDQTVVTEGLRSNVFWGVLIVVFWEAYVADPSKSMTNRDLPEPLSKIVGAFDPAEIANALRFLSREDGCKILLRLRDEHSPTDWRYRFNAVFDDCLQDYCVELRGARSVLASALAPYLG